jgi:hypothetical protein
MQQYHAATLIAGLAFSLSPFGTANAWEATHQTGPLKRLEIGALGLPANRRRRGRWT